MDTAMCLLVLISVRADNSMVRRWWAFRFHAQTVGKADPAARNRLLDGHNAIAMALQLDFAQIVQARVLEALRQLRISQCGLAQLDVKLRTKEAFNVRQWERVLARSHVIHELLQTLAH